MGEARIRTVRDTDLTGLTELLCDVVAGGASVGFLAPLTAARAEAFWRGQLAEVEAGRKRILVAVDEARLLGTIQLQLAQPENQPHRADVAKLQVHREGRGRGLGGRLVRAIEAEAARLGKTLLVLDTVTGSDAERLYLRHGWQRCGEIPDFALWPDGRLCPTTVYYKRVGAG